MVSDERPNTVGLCDGRRKQRHDTSSGVTGDDNSSVVKIRLTLKFGQLVCPGELGHRAFVSGSVTLLRTEPLCAEFRYIGCE